MPTLRSAAELLAAAASLDTLEPLAAFVGCGPALRVDKESLRGLGVDALAREARICAGPGSIRALLIDLPPDAEIRDALSRIATRLGANAPHVLWLVVATQPEAGQIVIAAWGGQRNPPRVVGLQTRRDAVVDSDAETLRALATAADPSDLLTHARWIDVLGRDALSARFYRGLQRAVAQLADSSSVGTAEDRSNIALLNTSRLLFLSFLEAKGWLDGDRGFLARLYESTAVRGGRFHDRALRPLFFGTLNTPARDRSGAARQFGNIPFLNGGLFARTYTERTRRGLTFSDDAYGALLFDLFAQFRFTAREETSAWSEAAIDPEMLGRAFECLMASRERKRSGAFYTPFSLVERVTHHGFDVARTEGREHLSTLTVLDPACGSGAFLVHALERLASRQVELGDARPIAAVRRDVLTRAIFGVDINPTAVWLCQLRLWLSVVIESEELNPANVVPLPNLDRNVRVGDALAGPAFGPAKLGGASADVRRLRERYSRATGARKQSLARALDRLERSSMLAAIDDDLASLVERRRDLVLVRRGRDLFGDRYRPSAGEAEAARAMRRTASSLRAQRTRVRAGGAMPFSFRAHFADVAAAGGFGLVLGNPPWVRLHDIPATMRVAYRREYEVARAASWESGAASAAAGSGFASQVDVASMFIERSVSLLAPNGALSLLVPAKLWHSLAGGGVRRLLSRDTTLCSLEDHSEAPAEFDAAVYPSLFSARRVTSAADNATTSVRLGAYRRGHAMYCWTLPKNGIAFDATAGAPWLILPPDARHSFDAMRDAGIPLSQSVLGRPYLGVKCGLNEAFVVELVDVRGDVADIVGSDGVATSVEARLVRPLLRGEALRRWRVPHSYESIIWTHDEQGAPLAALPPLAARWFTRWRSALLGRADLRGRARWWSLFRTESARDDCARVIWGDVGREPRASVLLPADKRTPLNTCYVVRCAESADAFAFAALLNSPICRAWLDVIAEPARGGYRRYLGWTLALLPIPKEWQRARDILAPIGVAAAGGQHIPESQLLDAAAMAYGLSSRAVSPLVAWSSA